MSRISLVKVTGNEISKKLEVLLRPFIANISLSGKSVLIKPNLVEPVPFTTGQTTNPALIEAIIEWCKKMGAQKIAIGEGPSYFQPQSALRECFSRTGIVDSAQRQNVPWILFDEGPFREYKNHSPRLPESFFISEHAFIWDHIINVSVPKTHYLTLISNAMKNLKGFIRRADKPLFHHCGEEGIHGSVSELNLLIRPALNIVDCTAPTHTNHNFILAGIDIVALDTIVASLMGVNPEKVKTIQLASKQGLGETDMASIEIIGDDLKDLTMSFEQPEEYLQRTFPNISLKAQTACSGCLIPLFASLRRMEEEGLHTAAEASLVCGKDKADSKSDKICYIGYCTQAHKSTHPWLNGCPPTKEELYEFLKKNLFYC